MTPESKAKADVVKSLGALCASGDVFWYSRMQSGVFTVDGNRCHACEAGTFDLAILFSDKDKNLAFAFIEVKRSDKHAELSLSQKKFKIKYDGKHPRIYFWLVQSGNQVERLVLDHCYDRLANIQLEG